MVNIFKKEIRSLLLSPVGFTSIAVMLLFSGLFITRNHSTLELNLIPTQMAVVYQICIVSVKLPKKCYTYIQAVLCKHENRTIQNAKKVYNTQP